MDCPPQRINYRSVGRVSNGRSGSHVTLQVGLRIRKGRKFKKEKKAVKESPEWPLVERTRRNKNNGRIGTGTRISTHSIIAPYLEREMSRQAVDVLRE